MTKPYFELQVQNSSVKPESFQFNTVTQQIATGPMTAGNVIGTIGITAIKAEYAQLIDSIERGDLGAVAPLIASLRQRICDLKTASLFFKDVALYLQGLTAAMAAAMALVISDLQGKIQQMNVDKVGVEDAERCLNAVIHVLDLQIESIQCEIAAANAELERKEQERAAKRDSSFVLWRWVKKAFYATLEALEAAINALKDFLGGAQQSHRDLLADLALAQANSAGLKRRRALLEQSRLDLDRQLRELLPLHKALTDLQHFFQVNMVFFNNVAEFYVRAAVYSDNINFGVRDVGEILELLSSDTRIVDYYVSSQLERGSLEQAMIAFDQIIDHVPQVTSRLEPQLPMLSH